MILTAIPVLVCFALLTFHYWQRVFGPESSLGPVPFSRWLWAGLILPSGVWMFLNCGLLAGLPQLLRRIALVKLTGGKWLPLVFHLPAAGLMVIGSYWTAVTFAHISGVIVIHAESRREFAVMAGFWSLVLSPFVWVCSTGGLGWAGVPLLIWLVPVAHSTLALACRPKPVPMY